MAKSNLDIIINAKDNASKPVGAVGQALGKLGKFVSAGAIAAGIVAIGAAAVKAAIGMKQMAEEGAKLQAVENAFLSMGSSMKMFLAEMQAASGGLITNTDLMKSYNDAALLVSDTFAQRMPEALQYLTKIAGATGQSLDYLLNSFVTGVGRESPLILDNLRVVMGSMEDVVKRWAAANVDAANALIDHTAEIADNSAELSDMQKQLAILIQKQREFTDATSKSTKMSVQNQIDKLRARMEALKGETAALGDAATFTDGEIAQMIENMDAGTRKMILADDVLKKLADKTANLEQITNPIGVMTIAWQNFGDTFKKLFAKTVLPLLQKIAPVFSKFFEIFGRILGGDVFEDVFAGLRELPGPLQTVIKAAKFLFDVFKNLTSGGIGQAFSFIAFKIQQAFGDKAYQFVIAIKTQFEKAFNTIKSGAKTVGKFLAMIWKPIQEKLLPALGDLFIALVQAFGGNTDKLIGGLGDVLLDVGGYISQIIIPALADFVMWLGTWLPQAIRKVGDFFTEVLVGKVLPLVRQFIGWLSVNVPKAISFLKGIWYGTLQPMFENFGAWFTEKILPVLQNFSTWIQTNWPVWMANIKTWWGETWESIKVKAAEIWESIKQIVSTKFEEAKVALGIKADALGVSLQQKFGTIKLLLLQKMLEWKSAFIGIDWNAVGRAIGSGIVNGLLAMESIILDVLQGIAQGALDAIKESLGISSPSKEFAKIGQMAMAGLAQGIEKFGAVPIKATGSIGGDMLSSVGGGRGRGGGGNITLVYSPAFSAASAQEFEQKLVPMIDRQLNHNQRRRVERR